MEVEALQYSDEMTEDELVAFSRDPKRETLHALQGSGRRVVKVSDQKVMKFGLGIREEEAEMQKLAGRVIDPLILRVPLVYRFFARGRSGYILMEYIHGRVSTAPENPDVILKVSQAILSLSDVQCYKPGPLASGIPRGILWPENEDLSLKTVQDVERHFNSRLCDDKKLDLTGHPLVLCHLDIAPRNIIWPDNGSLYLLDWESAGFYPRFFEVCSQRINLGKNGDFQRLLLESIGRLTEEEDAQADLILRAFSNGQKFYL